MKRFVFAIVLAAIACATLSFAQTTPEEQAVWKLEHSYWDYVKANDLTSYLALWNENFIGWPSVSERPVHKDHITDWMAAHTRQGEHLQSYKLEEADSRVTGNIVVTYYWITQVWEGKSGAQSARSRITHTWLRSGESWQTIGGMSSAENVKP